ncbi:lysophospholipid acyltransferase family protein [Microbacterium sp. STN6]|uniref:lysophospholipid acyltransferase family protein n=1 Tax=Microbacterium sp. STN6 TaxID=2995588 RepID=UPI002260B4D2|nr:lysophospholipid acyltransferase family protein [Microbacterium sp. STN6]MCX7522089.1 lysophospholipid acyltransferase family protein [Microbacterium sp. STN6]
MSTPQPATKRARSERSRPSIFWVLAAIILPIVGLMAKVRVVDGEKLPKHAACVVAPNHYSEIDPVIVGIAMWKLGRLPRFLAKGSLFRVPVGGWFLRTSGQIPVERTGSARGGSPLDAAQQLAEHQQAVIVYPEGSLTRDPDMWPMRGKTGAARMALVHGIPVIPVAHWGTQKVMARYSKKIHVFPPRPVTVKVGDPVDLSRFRGRPVDQATLLEATNVIMDAITRLLEDLRGENAPAERWDPQAHDQRETGRFEA